MRLQDGLIHRCETVGPQPRKKRLTTLGIGASVLVEELVLVEVQLLLLGDVRRERGTPGRKRQRHLGRGLVDPHREVVGDVVHHVGRARHLLRPHLHVGTDLFEQRSARPSARRRRRLQARASSTITRSRRRMRLSMLFSI
jgi:hypothetical protein